MLSWSPLSHAIRMPLLYTVPETLHNSKMDT